MVKIKKNQLKNIIKESVKRIISESNSEEFQNMAIKKFIAYANRNNIFIEYDQELDKDYLFTIDNNRLDLYYFPSFLKKMSDMHIVGDGNYIIAHDNKLYISVNKEELNKF